MDADESDESIADPSRDTDTDAPVEDSDFDDDGDNDDDDDSGDDDDNGDWSLWSNVSVTPTQGSVEKPLTSTSSRSSPSSSSSFSASTSPIRFLDEVKNEFKFGAE